MEARSRLGNIRKCKYLLVVVVAFSLVACGTSFKRVQTWEGQSVSDDGIAVLEAPGDIRVSRVNSMAVGNFLADGLDLEYELLPGDNRVVFTYRSIWARGQATEDGESKVTVVESKPHQVELTVRAGQTYQFAFDKPESRAGAEAMAQTMSVSVVDSEGTVIATASELSEGAERPAPAPEQGGDGQALQELKAIWGTATPEQRQEFLRWALD